MHDVYPLLKGKTNTHALDNDDDELLSTINENSYIFKFFFPKSMILITLLRLFYYSARTREVEILI